MSVVGLFDGAVGGPRLSKHCVCHSKVSAIAPTALMGNNSTRAVFYDGCMYFTERPPFMPNGVTHRLETVTYG